MRSRSHTVQVQTVLSTFPDMPRERILYDLSKTKNVQSTVERILEVGTLPAVSPSLASPGVSLRLSRYPVGLITSPSCSILL
jgi:hypothetical protein